ncbi:MAG: P-II family nitrogen regulator [Suipraeoptans sp.]
MKKLEIVIQPEKLEDLKSLLDENNVNGLMITNIMGYGHQKGHKKYYRGAEYNVNLLPKVKVETIVDTGIAEELITKIVNAIQTDTYGDGKIFVYDVEDAVRIRTGERGPGAI